MTATTPPPLPADLTDGLKRLKMAAMRQLAPELLVTAKTQRWKPEEFLRTLVEAEITARDASNARTRLRQASFPVTKTLEEFDVAASSIPVATFDYLASLEWIRAAENVCLIGPAGTGKSHMLVALGMAAVEAGHRVRYFTAAELVETLYRGLADNSVGRVIDTLLRNDVVLVDELGFAPLDDTGAAVPIRRRRLRTPLTRHRIALALRILGTLPTRTHHRRQHARPAPAPLPHRRHRR
jgi:DNA replication protein DnaC